MKLKEKTLIEISQITDMTNLIPLMIDSTMNPLIGMNQILQITFRVKLTQIKNRRNM